MKMINEAAYERVYEAIDDLGYVCDTRDDPNEWEDVASSSITKVMENLDPDQLSMTCEAFRETIADNYHSKRNFAVGLKLALIRSLEEFLQYYSDAKALLGAGQEWDEDAEEFVEAADWQELRETVENELDLTKRQVIAF